MRNRDLTKAVAGFCAAFFFAVPCYASSASGISVGTSYGESCSNCNESDASSGTKGSSCWSDTIYDEDGNVVGHEEGCEEDTEEEGKDSYNGSDSDQYEASASVDYGKIYNDDYMKSVGIGMQAQHRLDAKQAEEARAHSIARLKALLDSESGVSLAPGEAPVQIAEAVQEEQKSRRHKLSKKEKAEQEAMHLRDTAPLVIISDGGIPFSVSVQPSDLDTMEDKDVDISFFAYDKNVASIGLTYRDPYSKTLRHLPFKNGDSMTIISKDHLKQCKGITRLYFVVTMKDGIVTTAVVDLHVL